MIEANRGEEVVDEIRNFSERLTSQTPTSLIYALVACVRMTCQGENNNNEHHLRTKRAAFQALPVVCQTVTQLGDFMYFFKEFKLENKGYGRGLKKAVRNWYLSRSPRDLAYVTTKYVQRRGWKHKDLFKLCHIFTDTPGESKFSTTQLSKKTNLYFCITTSPNFLNKKHLKAYPVCKHIVR